LKCWGFAVALHVLIEPPKHNNMPLDLFSLLGATMSLECAILLLGTALFLDYRRALRRRRLLGNLKCILQSNRRPVLVDMPDAA
jgi:hypothetical protein